jgi:hypothetical protein
MLFVPDHVAVAVHGISRDEALVTAKRDWLKKLLGPARMAEIERIKAADEEELAKVMYLPCLHLGYMLQRLQQMIV